MKWTADELWKKDLAWLHKADDVEMEIDAAGQTIGTTKNTQPQPNLPVIDKSVPDQESEDIDFDLPPAGEGFSDDPFGDMADDMDVDAGDPGVPEASRSSGDGATVGAGNISKETPVLKNATPSRGLQETHTAICVYNE